MGIQKFDIASDNRFSLSYSISEGNVFIHCDVYKWGLSVLRDLYLAFGMFIETVSSMGVCRIFCVTPNPKFAELFGAIRLTTEVVDGKEYEVMKWDLK